MPKVITSYPPEFETGLREYISYDPETGILRWIERPGQRVNVGDEIGSLTKDGHLDMTFMGRRMRAHRVCWFLYYGTWPLEIDHWDTDGTNNRIRNLRDANHQINGENKRKANKNNKSTGLLGAYFTSEGHAKPFKAAISVKNTYITIGYFDTAEEAHAAYVEAKRKYHKGNTL